MLLDDNLPLHEGVNRAVIGVSAWGAERFGKGLAVIQNVGVETRVVRCHRVGGPVLIGPLHLHARGDG